MARPMIKVEGLSKQYRLGVFGYGMLYRDIQSLWARMWGREDPNSLVGVKDHGRRAGSSDRFWALKDISFELNQGETLGIIGRNGAGKSTLLKILSRITTPTTGQVKLGGRVASLLEVGTGFHPELTGRENVFLSGAILGMTRNDVSRKLEEIVDFSGIEEFIDTPIKRYSSGMNVRLGFAVAAHLEPDILCVDEVLAVGDAEFRKKCLGKMSDVAGEGRTVLFVSHNMTSIKNLCQRGIWLDEGEVVQVGEVDRVVDAYMVSAGGELKAEVYLEPDPNQAAGFTRLCLRKANGDIAGTFENSEPIILEIEYEVRKELNRDNIFVLLDSAANGLLLKTCDDDGDHPIPDSRPPGTYLRRFMFPGGILNEGVYRFRVTLGKRRGLKHDRAQTGYFEIMDATDYTDKAFGKRNGLLLMPLEWTEDRLTGERSKEE